MVYSNHKLFGYLNFARFGAKPVQVDHTPQPGNSYFWCIRPCRPAATPDRTPTYDCQRSPGRHLSRECGLGFPPQRQVPEITPPPSPQLFKNIVCLSGCQKSTPARSLLIFALFDRSINFLTILISTCTHQTSYFARNVPSKLTENSTFLKF